MNNKKETVNKVYNILNKHDVTLQDISRIKRDLSYNPNIHYVTGKGEYFKLLNTETVEKQLARKTAKLLAKGASLRTALDATLDINLPVYFGMPLSRLTDGAQKAVYEIFEAYGTELRKVYSCPAAREIKYISAERREEILKIFKKYNVNRGKTFNLVIDAIRNCREAAEIDGWEGLNEQFANVGRDLEEDGLSEDEIKTELETVTFDALLPDLFPGEYEDDDLYLAAQELLLTFVTYYDGKRKFIFNGDFFELGVKYTDVHYDEDDKRWTFDDAEVDLDIFEELADDVREAEKRLSCPVIDGAREIYIKVTPTYAEVKKILAEIDEDLEEAYKIYLAELEKEYNVTSDYRSVTVNGLTYILPHDIPVTTDIKYQIIKGYQNINDKLEQSRSNFIYLDNSWVLKAVLWEEILKIGTDDGRRCELEIRAALLGKTPAELDLHEAERIFNETIPCCLDGDEVSEEDGSLTALARLAVPGVIKRLKETGTFIFFRTSERNISLDGPYSANLSARSPALRKLEATLLNKTA